MSASTRLAKLLPSLTPKQRAVLVLRARNANTEPAPELLRDTRSRSDAPSAALWRSSTGVPAKVVEKTFPRSHG